MEFLDGLPGILVFLLLMALFSASWDLMRGWLFAVDGGESDDD